MTSPSSSTSARRSTASFNGLARVADTSPELLAGDFAVLLEPTNGAIEGGCKGTLRVEVVTKGVAAHSARPWKGHNAIHDAGAVLTRLAAYEAETITVDGLDYHEALQAVGISGGIAGNVIPDRCTVTVNYRYAPDKNTEEAFAHVRQVFEGFDVTFERRRRRRASGPAPARRQGVHRRARCHRQPQGGLDRRRALLGARHPRRQLRARRPQPRAHGRRALPGRAVRRGRGRPAALARLTSPHRVAL